MSPRRAGESPPGGGDGDLGGREDAVLTARGLTVEYGTGAASAVAVDAVDLDIARGERVALVGESGSGKSSLGLAIAGFQTAPTARVSAERVVFGGRTLDRSVRPSAIPHATPGMAMMFQDAMTSLDPVWRIGSQLVAVVRARGGVRRSDAAAEAAGWLRRVGLDDTERVLAARPYELSGGMRQRAMLAMTLAGRPSLLIADEPTSALDASLAREMMELLVASVAESGSALLVISHDIRLCQEFADRVLVMYRGRIVDGGPAADLDASVSHPYARGLLRCVPTLDSYRLEAMPTLADDLAARRPGQVTGPASVAPEPRRTA